MKTVRKAASEDGMTLVEVMVTAMVMGVILAATYAALFSVQRGVNRQMNRAESVAQARLAVESLDRELRSAEAWTVPGNAANTMTAYTQTNVDTRGGKQCVQYLVQHGNLQYRRFPNPPAAGVVYPWRTIATHVRNQPVVSPVFTRDLLSGPYGGRLVTVRLLTNANPDEDEDIVTTTAIVGRNITDPAAANPCDGYNPLSEAP